MQNMRLVDVEDKHSVPSHASHGGESGAVILYADVSLNDGRNQSGNDIQWKWGA
jgi:hypothetical protein